MAKAAASRSVSSGRAKPSIDVPEAFDFLFTPHGEYRYRGSHGGRGSAKSHSFATALVVKGRAQPLRILCCREVQRSIKDSVKRLLDDKIEACGFGGFYSSTETEIRGRNGTLFVFGGLRTNPDTIKSLEGLDLAWIEEANRVSQRSLDILIPTVRKPGSEIWASWNPELQSDPIDDMFRGKNESRRPGEVWSPPPRSIVREVNFDANPFFPEVLREEMEWDKRRDPDKYHWIWRGGYRRNSEARVFNNWRVESFDTPAAARFHHGADWGFSIDPTVLIRCFIEGRTLYIDQEAYKIGCEIDRLPALFDRIPSARRWPIVADSARPETISYMAGQGFRIRPAMKGAGSVEDGIEFMKSFDIVVHPRCKHTIDELTLYSFKIDPKTGEVLPVLEDKQNHVIDAVRYAVEAVRRGQSMMDVL